MSSLKSTSRPGSVNSDEIVHQKSRRHLKRGAFAKMLDLPNEILENIFSHFTPRELLRLSRVNKKCRHAMLVDWNPRAWQVARHKFFQAPDPPYGMSEPEYATYLAEKVCSVCGSKAVLVDAVTHIRFCNKHLHELAIPLTPSHWRKIFPRDDFNSNAPDFYTVKSLIPTKMHNNRDWARIDTLRIVANEYVESIQTTYADSGGWQNETMQDANDDRKLQNEIAAWRQRVDGARVAQHKQIVEQRKTIILTKLHGLGFADKDLKVTKKLHDNKSWEALLRQPQEVTDEHWAKISPKIESIMITRRKQRIHEGKVAAKEGRRILIEATLCKVRDEEIGTAPWNVLDPNPMKALFHAAMPTLDNIPQAREYIKGHKARLPSRADISSHVEARTKDQILRTRALLAKFICAADHVRSTTNATACDISLTPDTVKKLEEEIDKMTIEKLEAGDAEAKARLFHPTAIFYPLKPLSDKAQPPAQRKSEMNLDHGGRLMGAPVTTAPRGADAMNSTLLSTSSATSFYPAVFKKSSRPMETSPTARELRVDYALRETAAFILQKAQPALKQEFVMQKALENEAVFLCEHCPDLAKAHASKDGGTSDGLLSWVQLVAHYAHATGRSLQSAIATSSPLFRPRPGSQSQLATHSHLRTHECPKIRVVVDPAIAIRGHQDTVQRYTSVVQVPHPYGIQSLFHTLTSFVSGHKNTGTVTTPSLPHLYISTGSPSADSDTDELFGPNSPSLSPSDESSRITSQVTGPS